MKHRLLHLLLIIVPLQAREPSQIQRHLPYCNRTRPQSALSPELDWIKELRRYQKKADLRSRGHKRELSLEKKRKYSWFDICVRAAIFGVCGWLAWNNRYEMIAALLGGEVFLRHQIMVGNSPCEGREVQISDDITFKQVQVAHQSGSTCGYHGVCRCMQLVDAFNNGRADLGGRLPDAREINNLIKNGRRPEQDGLWRRLVKRYRRGQIEVGRGKVAHGGSTWLNDGDIQEIVTDEVRNNRITGVGFNGKQLSVCSNPSLLGNQDGFDYVIPVMRARGFGTVYPFTHGLVLGDMQQYDDKSGSAGHWIAVVLHQRDARNKEYIVADSCNGLAWRGGDYRIRRLLQALEGRGAAEAYCKGGS